jgi:6-phosphofructokinase 1
MAKPAQGVLLVGQSGGPTPVINASLAGVIEEAQQHTCFTGIYGLVHGIEGALNDTLRDLTHETPENLALLAQTPASALGSCRHKLSAQDYDRILRVFKSHNVRHFVYIGGNDSMDTCQRITNLSETSNYEMQVMGIPKTIDNDLVLTDHCPGYGSAARFLALATRDTGRDLESMATFDDVVILEAMGRNAGWLTAGSALGKKDDNEAPHLVYIPELPFEEDRFIAELEEIHSRLGRVFVVVSEGIRDKDGRFIGEHQTQDSGSDAFGHVVHALTTGVASYLSSIVNQRLSLQARFLRPGLIGRAMSSCVSKTDRHEARAIGRFAVEKLTQGHSGSMITIDRRSDQPYDVAWGIAPLQEVANAEKLIPREYMDDSGNMITEAFRQYAMPLIDGPLPPYTRLQGSIVSQSGTA